MTISGAVYREGIAYSADGAMYVTQTGAMAVANGGTGATTAQVANQNLQGQWTLSQSSVPFIYLSSGSVAANGAISGITALPVVYAKAFCYFPANALATVKAAGWYYCTFSTTTAGVAFLDAYTSGTPVLPTSPTAVTDGKGAFASVTADTTGISLTLPANSLGLNGSLEMDIQASCTNNANAKTMLAKLGASTINTLTLTSLLNLRSLLYLHNRGATAVQSSNPSGLSTSSTGLGSSANVQQQFALDTTGALTLIISASHATATDNVIIERYTARVTYLN